MVYGAAVLLVKEEVKDAVSSIISVCLNILSPRILVYKFTSLLGTFNYSRHTCLRTG